MNETIHSPPFRRLATVATIVAGLLAAPVHEQATAEDIDFEQQVRPIFEENCWHCHGEDEQESKLRLDRRAFMLRGGNSGQPALVPGKPEQSYLLQLIQHKESGLEMPPEEDKLPDGSIAIVREWIRQGASWPGQMDEKAAAIEGADHWSLRPVKRPEVPADGDPIDVFLNVKLKSAGVEPNEQADPRALIRRASIVLTGLIPTPGEVNEFLAAYDKNPSQAYGKLVDRLMASPHFGERWAQHWLDVIRWAETNGSEANLYRKNAWMYRDYVVNAFNGDKPYDQFVREQLAGDTIGAGTGLGFLVSGPHVPAATVGQEASAIRQARADRMDEIIQTVGASMMGLTVGCARCHNHKFDPLTITDYYSLSAVFQDIEFGGRIPELAESDPQKKKVAAWQAEIDQLRDQLRSSGPWLEHWGGYMDANFPRKKVKAIRVKFQSKNASLDELEVFGPDDRDRNLAHAREGAIPSGASEMVWDPRNKITRINDGEYGTMAWRARAPNGSKERPWVQIDFKEPQLVDRVRLSTNREYFYEVDYLDKKIRLALNEFQIDVLTESGEWQPTAGSWWIKNKLNPRPERADAVKRLNRLISQVQTQGPQYGFVGRFIKPATTYVFHRGSPESPRAEVPPAAPSVLAGDLGLNSEATGAQRRKRFADWMTDPQNPLTARVMVNRIWHHVFGSGIVTTTSDFGTAGAKPTHPKLLEWLAAEFVRPTSGSDKPWSMKHMIRAMVLSAAFRRSSAPTEAGLKADAGSALLWRFPPRRVEAEVLRDSILLASGSLNPKLGGKGYRIHNVKKTYAQWQVINNHGPETWRRMIYQERFRRVDDRMFTAFDFPDCGQIRARRPVSTTPLQALNLMNSDFVVEQAALLARRAKKESGDDIEAQVARCFELLLNRKPEPDELAACVTAVQQSSFEVVCRTLMNSNEFAFLP